MSTRSVSEAYGVASLTKYMPAESAPGTHGMLCTPAARFASASCWTFRPATSYTDTETSERSGRAKRQTAEVSTGFGETVSANWESGASATDEGCPSLPVID